MNPRPSAHIWMAAEQFYNAAEHIWNSNNPGISYYALPLIVNYTFSCELSLKSSEGIVRSTKVTEGQLLPAVGIESSVRGHKLDIIFRNLKSDTQSFLEKEFIASTGEFLIPLLEECSNYFESARYSYEQKGGSYNLSGVRTLAKGLLDSVMAYGKK